MSEARDIERITAEVTPLSGLAKWIVALARAVLRRHMRRASVEEPQPLGACVSQDAVPIASESTQASATAVVEGAIRKGRAKVGGTTMAKSKAKTTRPKSKRKTTLPVVLLLLLGAALGTTACGVRLPAVTFAPLDPTMAGGEMPSVNRTVTTTDGVVLGGGSFFINPAAMLMELGRFSGALFGKLTGTAPTAAPAPAVVAGTVGPRAGGA